MSLILLSVINIIPSIRKATYDRLYVRDPVLQHIYAVAESMHERKHVSLQLTS